MMGIGIVGSHNQVTGCYLHDFTRDIGDTGSVNSSGGAEGIVVFGGSHIDVGHNTVIRAACPNETLGGDEGGCTEIIMNPIFFQMMGDVVEDVQFHHTYCVDSVGLFESCQGTGEPGFDPTENPGTIRDITIAYNVIVNAKRMYLAQIVNTIHENVVFEHNTIIHGGQNDIQWSDNQMSHEYMFGMFFSTDTENGASVSDEVDDLGFRSSMEDIISTSTLSQDIDFSLAEGSPAIDAASSESFFEEDLLGNAPCGDGPDIGAVEFCD
jgi:hypothetical protein